MRAKSILTILSLFVLSSAALTCSSFASPTLEEIRQNAIPIDGDALQPSNIFTNQKVILLGEMHGTNESPADFFKLVKLISALHRSVLVGLEIPQDFQTVLNQFMVSGDLKLLEESSFFNPPAAYQDGRESQAMATLIDNLRSLKNVTTYCFDPTQVDPSTDINLAMAQDLIQERSAVNPEVTLILTGQCHAMLSKQGCGSDIPMAYELLQNSADLNLNNVLSMDLRYESGSAWVNMVGGNGPGVHFFAPTDNVYSEALSIQSYLFKDPTLTDDGFNGALFERTISASFPFNSAK